MSTREETINGHPIHQTLKNILSISNDESFYKDQATLNLIQQITFVTEYIQNAISSLVPELIPLNTLTDTNNNLNPIINEINSYKGHKNSLTLNKNINTHIDNALRSISVLPSTKKINLTNILSKAATRYQERTNKYLNEIGQEKENLQNELNNLKEKIKEQTTIIEQQNNAIQSHQQRLDTIIPNFQNKTLEELKEMQARFQNQLQENMKNYETFEKEIRQKNDELENSLKAKSNDINNQLSTQSDIILNELESKKEKSAKLLGLIGTMGLTGNYKTTASEERKTANIWRRIALGFLIGMIIVTLFFLWFSISHPVTWETIIFRITTILIFLVGVGYCAFESSRHRDAEFSNKRMELELASIDPYLESFTDEKNEEIKIKLAEKFFGNINMRTDSDKKYFPKLLNKAMETITDLAKSSNTRKQ